MKYHEHTPNRKSQRVPVTHEELLRLRDAWDNSESLSPKERNPHESRLREKFRTAIKEARTHAELKALAALMSNSKPDTAVCPPSVKSHLASKMKQYAANEAKKPAAQLAEAH
jgi:hypothetical protein